MRRAANRNQPGPAVLLLYWEQPWAHLLLWPREPRTKVCTMLLDVRILFVKSYKKNLPPKIALERDNSYQLFDFGKP